MIPQRVITVFKCPCQSFIVSEEGLEGHLYNCSKLQNEVARVNQDGKPSSENGGLTMVNFHCPEVRLQRLSYSDIYTIKLECQIKSELNCDENSQLKKSKIDPDPVLQEDIDVSIPPPPRRSRLLAAQKLRRISGYLLNEKADSSFWNATDDVDDDDDYNPELPEDFKPETSRSNFRAKRKSIIKKNNKRRVSNELCILKCNQCTARFPSKCLFDLHMFKVHGEGNKKYEILTCPVCKRMISRRLPFQKHLKLHVDAEGLEDAFDLWNKWPDKHKSAEIGLKLYCKYCLIPQTSHNTFISHMKQEHPENGRFCKYLCQFCNVSEFDSMSKFVVHIKTTHPKQFYGKNTIKWTGAEEPELWNASEKPKARCDICSKLFDVFYLRTHKERKHPAKNDDDEMDESGDLFKCAVPDCHAKFKFRQRLKQHFILHMVNNPYKCKVPGCNVSCDAQCHLDRHMKLHTDQRERVACDKCGVTYARKDKLKNHKCIFDPSKLKYDPNGYLCSITSHSRLTRMQADSNEQKCDPVIKMENKTGRRKRHININEVIRSDPVFIQVCKNNPSFKELILWGNSDSRGPRKSKTKTHKCVKCSTKFYDRKALEKHTVACDNNLKNVTSENEESEMENKPQASSSSGIGENDNVEKLGCPICGKSFENSSSLESHLEEAHDPEEVFRCTNCQIIFSSSQVLKRHNQLHHSYRPFKCDIPQCTQSYGTERGLQLHKENHVTTVECTKCTKVLSCSESLVRHWWLIHGVKVRPLLMSQRRKSLKRIKRIVRKKKIEYYQNKNVISSKKSYNTRNETKSKYLRLDSAVKIETEAEMIIDDSVVKLETETEMIIDDSVVKLETETEMIIDDSVVKLETETEMIIDHCNAETNFEYEVPDCFIKQEPNL